MNCLFPDYYPRFRCVGSACQDNCCIGWEICIDADTLDYYRSRTGALGEQLAQNIALTDQPHFILDDRQRCPFLNGQNLCQLHIQLGEQHLCSICAQHPRFHNWFGTLKESGVGLCCEEAARLILFSAGFGFVSTVDRQPPDPDSAVPAELLQGLQAVRQTVFGLLQNTRLSLLHRLCLVTALAQDLQGWFDQSRQPELTEEQTATEFCVNACHSIAEFYRDADCHPDFIAQLSHAVAPVSSKDLLPQILRFHRQLAANDPNWHIRLKGLEQHLPSLGKLEQFPELVPPLQRIAQYFVYRYFLAAGVEGDVLSGLLAAVVATLVIALLQLETYQQTGSITPWQQICNAKAYSKEVEYSPENQQQLTDALWTEDFFAPTVLMGCLLQGGEV